jgi:hypothetical protein
MIDWPTNHHLKMMAKAGRLKPTCCGSEVVNREGH